MPGTLNVGGHDIITHSGDAGAGDVTVNVQNRLVLDSSGNVGIGTSSPSGKLNVTSGSSGASPWGNADDFVVETNGPTGISILAPDNNQANLILGSPSDNIGSIIRWVHDDGELQVGTHKSNGFLTFKTAIGEERMRIDSSGRVGIGITNPGYTLEVKPPGTSGAFRVSASGFSNQILINDGQTTRQGATFVPHVNDSYDLGASSNKWDDIYATNDQIITSDANEKENITTSDLSLDFIKQLNPVSYRFIGKSRTHYGLIAQEIETLLSNIGKESFEFAGFIKSPVTDEDGNETGEYKYGLRYSEFISPMIKAIQEQQSIIEALTARIEALENA